MKKISKKMLSFVLSAVMVVTMLPTFVLSNPTTAEAKTTWSLVSSTDFTGTTWNYVSNDNSYNYTGATGFKSVDGGTSTYASWAGIEYWQNETDYMDSGWNKFYTDPAGASGKGTMVRDGFLYMANNYENGASVSSTKPTPITGLDSFKIDLEFQFWNDFGSTSNHRMPQTDIKAYTFLKLKTDNYRDESNMWQNNWFSQAGYGSLYDNDDSENSPSVKRENNASTTGYYQIGTSNDNISKNTSYHYIAEYTRGVMHAYIVDSEGELVANLGTVSISSSTNNIKGIQIGAATGNKYYYQNYAVKNIKFYSGTPINESNGITGKDKYIYAYFTGNDTNGEKLRFAVSDDGYNWEAINGGEAVTTISEEKAATLPVYPQNLTNTYTRAPVAGTGHVRDPYILQAPDGEHYYIIATDLNSHGFPRDGSGTRCENTKILCWYLDDLDDISTTDPWFIDTRQLMINAIGVNGNYIDRAWAPEAVWDSSKNMYMLYWSSGSYYGDSNNSSPSSTGKVTTRIYYSYTPDFKTFTTPKVLIHDEATANIDGNITYDGKQFYLWYKNEDQSKIGYRVSENSASGPWSNFVAFTDATFSSVFEGPEVYYDVAREKYILVADHYTSMSYLAAYTADDPSGFSTSNRIAEGTFNMTHLQPRHGGITNITSTEYYDLIDEYGKNTWCTTGVENGNTVNDYLIARYFTSNDVTWDATGNGHTLTASSQVAMSKTAPDDDDADNTANTIAADCVAPGGNSPTGGYLQANTSTWGLNSKDGVTFDWYSYSPSACNNTCQLVNWTSGTRKCSSAGNADAFRDYNYLMVNKGGTLEALMGTDSSSTHKHLSKSFTADAWHHYTMSISKNCVTYYIDGTLVSTTYAANGESITTQGSPLCTSALSDEFFTEAVNLYIGASCYNGDYDYYGYYKDFRIYNKALKYSDINDSLTELNDEDYGKTVDDSVAPAFYDPMETMAAEDSIDGTAKTTYSATTTNATYGKVLNTNGGVVTHNGTGTDNMYYEGSKTDWKKGYTISFWYNPGTATTGVEPIFKIGVLNPTDGTDWDKGRNVFSVSKDGALFYYYNLAGGDCEYCTVGQFSLTGDSAMTPTDGNTYTHVTIKVIPDGDYEILKTYINGTLQTTFRNYTREQFAAYGDSDICHYLASDRPVSYGYDVSDWTYWKNDVGYPYANASIDTYVDDFRIYNGLYSAASLYTDYQKKNCEGLLGAAITAYKDKMELLDGADHVYTNMLAAYNKYDIASRYLDSVKNGEVEVDVTKTLTLRNDLNTAKDAMKDYIKPTTKAGFSETDVNLGTGTSTLVNSSYTTNMLSTTDLNNQIQSDGGKIGVNVRGTNSDTSPSEVAAIYQSSFVWLYDGINTPKAPINCGFSAKSKTGVTARFSSLWVASGDVILGTDWKSRTNENSNYWIYDTGSTMFTNDSDNTSPTYNNGNCDDGEWLNASNVLSYNPTGDTKTALDGGSIYSTTLQPTYTGTFYDSWPRAFQSDRYVFYDHPITSTDSLPTIYVINFIKVENELLASARMTALSNVTNYTTTTARALLTAYDNMTSKSYIIDTVSAANVNSLVTSIQNGISDINTAVTGVTAKPDDTALTALIKKGTDDYAFYTAVVASEGAMVENKAEEGDDPVYGPVESGERYTTSSYKSYKKAVENARAYYTSLNPKVVGTDDYETAENQPYSSNADEINALAANISASKAHLVQAADYSSVEAAVAPSSANSTTLGAGNYTGDAQIYTYGSWINFVDKYCDAEDCANLPNSYKLEVPKYSIVYSQAEKNGVQGPYVAYDRNGDICTQANGKTPYLYYYVGEFYENEGDATPSRFETGEWCDVKANILKSTTTARTRVGNVRFYPGDTAAATSAMQNDIVDTANAVGTARSALARVDSDLAYTTYENAVEMVTSSLDPRKYTEEAIELYMNIELEDADNGVYKTLTDAEATAYSEYAGKTFYEGDKVKKTTTGGTDTYTRNVLSASTTLNAPENKNSYIKKYTVTFTVQDDESGDPLGTGKINGETLSTKDISYGDTATLEVPESILSTSPGYSIAVWGTSNKADDKSKTISSQKLSGSVSGNTYDKIVSGHVDVVVGLSKDTITSSNYRYNLCNAYGDVVEVAYNASNSYSTDGSNFKIGDDVVYTAPEVPFYTFKSWTITDTGNKTYKVRPVYTTEAQYNFFATGGTVNGATTTSTSKARVGYDKRVTLAYTGGGTFAAWAVRTEGGKYQIISYNPNYFSYACVDEEYVAIVSDGAGGYKPVDRDASLTAGDIDGLVADGVPSEALNSLVNDKIANSKTFISLQTVTMSSAKARVYARVTYGATDNAAFGVLFYNGDFAAETGSLADNNMKTGADGVYTRTVTSIIEATGQYNYTLNAKSTGFPKSNITFRAFVDYDASYTYNSTPYTLNARDYSAVAVATRA